MDFGIFDHLDASGAPLRDYYEDRLKLAEAYDRAGFYSYHLAEHHATPLGMAPSPSVFLAAVAQRTRRLRFGPMVFALPLYHPLRLIEEICMLDQMSGGRLDLGFGRGASPIELAYFGEDPAAAQSVYAEMLDLVRAGLTQRSLTFEGRHFRFKDVPMEIEPAASIRIRRSGTGCMHRKAAIARRARVCTSSASIPPRRAAPRLRGSAPAGPSAPTMLRNRKSALAASSSSPKPTVRPKRSPAAPIRAGTTASPISSAAMAPLRSTPVRRISTRCRRSAKAWPARPRPSSPICANSTAPPAPITASASSPSAI